MDIHELRVEVDRIDDEIVRLYCERMRVCAGIAQVKAQSGAAVYDPERETGKLADVLGKADEDLRVYVGELYTRIFQLSREYQESLGGSKPPPYQVLDEHWGERKGRFGLLGEKLGHSCSPLIHAQLADYEYLLYERAPDEVADFLMNGDFDGLNVTVPYKITVLPMCAALSETAARICSVNTIIRRDDGTLYGDNTDHFGFSCLLAKTDIDIKGKKAIVLGDGGAAATVRAVLNDSGAGETVTISRRGPDNYKNLSTHSNAQIVINATPVGMYPGNGVSPTDLRGFSSCELVLDLISNPTKTALVLQAEDLGIPCSGGLYMLLAQAARACELFKSYTARRIMHKTMDCQPLCGAPAVELFESIERQVKNIVLIGMPGCGKTSVGRYLAEFTNREFCDTDELVAARAGKSVERVILDYGEHAFRRMEEAVLNEVSKESGCVIATGGGIVTNPANRKLLRQNSVVVFLDRALEQLPEQGRPLSAARGVSSIYAERLPLYLEWCEHRITANGGAEETALAAKKAVKL